MVLGILVQFCTVWEVNESRGRWALEDCRSIFAMCC